MVVLTIGPGRSWQMMTFSQSFSGNHPTEAPNRSDIYFSNWYYWAVVRKPHWRHGQTLSIILHLHSMGEKQEIGDTRKMGVIMLIRTDAIFRSTAAVHVDNDGGLKTLSCAFLWHSYKLVHVLIKAIDFRATGGPTGSILLLGRESIDPFPVADDGPPQLVMIQHKYKEKRKLYKLSYKKIFNIKTRTTRKRHRWLSIHCDLLWSKGQRQKKRPQLWSMMLGSPDDSQL